MSPSVSIVVPCYNGAAFVSETIASVRKQTMKDWHLVVIDDGSTDGTSEVARVASDGDDRIDIVRQENKGLSGARMSGLNYLDNGSRYVIFLDADDLWVPTTLFDMVQVLDAQPDCVAVFGDEQIIDVNSVVSESYVPYGKQGIFCLDGRRIRRKHNVRELSMWDIAGPCPIKTAGACLVRRSAIEAGQCAFDQSFSHCEDLDFWFQIAQFGNIAYLPKTVLQYRQHSSNMSKQYDLMRSQRELFYVKNRECLSRNGSAVFRRLRAFAMYGYDARLCGRWCSDSVRRGDYIDAARFLRRAAVFQIRYVAALIRPA